MIKFNALTNDEVYGLRNESFCTEYFADFHVSINILKFFLKK